MTSSRKKLYLYLQSATWSVAVTEAAHARMKRHFSDDGLERPIPSIELLAGGGVENASPYLIEDLCAQRPIAVDVAKFIALRMTLSTVEDV